MTHSYGPDADQYGELMLPAGERRPGVVIVIHGGFWRSAFDASGGRPLCVEYAARLGLSHAPSLRAPMTGRRASTRRR